MVLALNILPFKKLRINFRKNINKDIFLGYAGRYARQKIYPQCCLLFQKLQRLIIIYICIWLEEITNKNDELSNLINELDIKKSFLFTRTKNLVQFTMVLIC